MFVVFVLSICHFGSISSLHDSNAESFRGEVSSTVWQAERTRYRFRQYVVREFWNTSQTRIRIWQSP